jgi:hypothetical protein
MAGESKSANNGIGCGTVLFLIFLTLKLTHNIDWSWWWVFAPLWIPLLAVPLIFCAVTVRAICSQD